METGPAYQGTGSKIAIGSRHLGLLAAVAVALMLTLPGAAAAGDGLPSAGSLYFARPTAKLVEGAAVVSVRCEGATGALCNGTISLAANGQQSESPFSVTSGGRRSVAVPVDGTGLSGAKALAVARTAQDAGGFVRSTEILRLR